MESNLTGFHHFAIKAQDFNKTVQFYKTLNFEVVHNWSLPEFNLEKCVMMKNTRKRKEGERYVENALLHICFSVKDAQKAYHHAISNRF